MYDSEKELEEATILRKEMLANPNRYAFDYSKVSYCIFVNKSTFPESFCLMCALPCEFVDAGLIYTINPSKHTYEERACQSKEILYYIYEDVKKNIVTNKQKFLGWEGRILNEPRYS